MHLEQAVLYASGLDSGPTVPFKLRPSTGTVENTNSSSKVNDSTSVKNENAIVHPQMLENVFNSIIGHKCDNASLKLSECAQPERPLHNTTTEMP